MVNEADGDELARANWRRQLIVVRHAASTKNTEDRYSTLDGREPLTGRGMVDLDRIANIVRRLVGEVPDGPVRVVSAPSRRCHKTAAAIADVTGAEVEISAALRPLRTPTLAGRTTTDARRRWPELLRNITHYRAGLMCAYDVGWPDEDIRDLEFRVQTAFGELLAFEQFGTNVLVGHKSSLTCVLISTLRNLGRYPETYYGYFDIPVGSITAFRSREAMGRNVVSVEYEVPVTTEVK